MEKFDSVDEAITSMFAETGVYARTQSSNKWIKFTEGTHKMRIIPAVNPNDPPLRLSVTHGFLKDSEGKIRSPFCFNALLSDQNLLDRYSSFIQKEDMESIKQYGCPLCQLGRKLATTDKEKFNKQILELRPRTRYFFNVLYRASNTSHIWGAGIMQKRTIEATYNSYKNLFDVDKGRDFTLTAHGKGLQRRYIGPIFEQEATPLNFPEGQEVYDLTGAVGMSFYPFDKVMDMLRTTHADLINETKKKKV